MQQLEMEVFSWRCSACVCDWLLLATDWRRDLWLSAGHTAPRTGHTFTFRLDKPMEICELNSIFIQFIQFSLIIDQKFHNWYFCLFDEMFVRYRKPFCSGVLAAVACAGSPVAATIRCSPNIINSTFKPQQYVFQIGVYCECAI